jgi:hypothetical protein
MPPFCDRTPLCCDRACDSLDYLKGGVTGVRKGARCSILDRRLVPPLGCDGNAISSDRLGWWLNEVKGNRAVHFGLGANFDDGFKDKARQIQPPFPKAADRPGVEPARCLALEVNGVRAASGAGIPSWRPTSSRQHPKERLWPPTPGTDISGIAQLMGWAGSARCVASRWQRRRRCSSRASWCR